MAVAGLASSVGEGDFAMRRASGQRRSRVGVRACEDGVSGAVSLMLLRLLRRAFSSAFVRSSLRDDMAESVLPKLMELAELRDAS